ncbi:hexose transporter [Dioszegia hungarica]|uniref:Hexose transporter n=1 Tax=Dioszegia hungarica TaxID=4972 RepID=A0AA38HDY8_9TREE|nr:hexose transporter [Dioszegia hungarica]KAI9638480.1 hexose transporter [Dioszegia hungarica]
MRFPNLKPKQPDSAEVPASQPSHHDLELKRLCKDRDTRWYAGHLLKLNLVLFFLLITSASNGYDGSMMNSLQTLSYWQDYFGNPSGGLLGLLNAIQNLGNLAGLPFAPFLNDRYGRRWTLFLGCIVMILATIIQSASQNLGMFLVGRFLIGFGNSWASIAGPILLTELAFPTHRAPITSLYNSMWYLGSIIAAWTTFGTLNIQSTWSWRIPSIVQGVPPLVQAVVVWFIPESPRWLLDHDQAVKARRVISKWHCEGVDTDPLVDFEFTEIQTALALEKEAARTTTYMDLFKNKGNIRRFRVIIALAFFSQWSGNGIVSYYLTIVLNGIGITETFEQNLLNGCLQIYNLITAVIGALTVEKAGRRVLFLTSTGGMCLSYMVWTILSATYNAQATEFDASGNPLNGPQSIGNGVIAVIFIYYGFYNIAMSPLIVSYTVEILPFRIRSKGLMVFQICVSFSLVFNQFVNPVALQAIQWRYYIVYTIWLAFEFIYLFFTVVETKGKHGMALPLEEISRLFDGDDAEVDLLDQGVVPGAAGDRRASDGTLLDGGVGLEKKGSQERGEIEQVEAVPAQGEKRF